MHSHLRLKKIRFVGSQKKLPVPDVAERPHPWRVCPRGFHCNALVEATSYRAFTHIYKCKANESKKEELYPFEMKHIARNEFADLKGAPKSNDLGFKSYGNMFNSEIRGWTKYWNDIFTPDTPLDPNLVKALIASESGFDEDPPGNTFARGIMQLTEQTRLALGNRKGELRNHLVILSRKDVLEPNYCIAGGIRWLFRKRETATAKLKRSATWEETVAEYKSYPLDPVKYLKFKGMQNFFEYYERLKK